MLTRSSGVLPELFGVFGLSVCLIKILTASVWPFSAARWIGVQPPLSWEIGWELEYKLIYINVGVGI